MLEVKWSQAQTQMNTLRRVQTQTAVYQHDMRHHLTMLEGLCALVKHTSLCGLGQSAPNPVLSALHFFRQEFLDRIQSATPLEEGRP